jgi:Ca-activated chloride channel family protein
MNGVLADFLHHFHWLRPYGLCLLIPAVLMSFLLYRHEKTRSAWQQLIAPELLLPLLQGKINTPRKTLALLTLLGWLLFTIALAGPSWEKLPTPVEKHDTALVILMDLSPSMLASDVKPSRLMAARHKIMDLLKLRKEGYTALIGYSGDAHVVSPLTDDTQTIASLLNVLEPAIMPVYGSNVEDALEQALPLFQNAGYTQGDILLVTDGMTPQAQENAGKILAGKKFTLSIIGVGTETGAPIPDAQSGFIKDKQGNILLPQLHAEQLVALAHAVGGHYSALQLDDSDIAVLADGRQLLAQAKTRKSEKEFDEWRDRGAVLCLALLPLLLCAFRRGVIISVLFALCLIHQPSVHADDSSETEGEPTAVITHDKPAMPPTKSWWDKLWLNEEQRAKKALDHNDYGTAASLFKDPEWKAYAQYKQDDYDSASKNFGKKSSPNALYNQGNALAKAHHLEEAINSYNEALKRKPDFKEASDNKKIVEDLLEQQKKQQQNQQQSSSSQDNSQQQSGDPSQQQHNDEGKPEKQPDNTQQQSTPQQSGQGQQREDQQQQGDQDQSSSQEAKDKAGNAQQQDQHDQAGQGKTQSAVASNDKQGEQAKSGADKHDNAQTREPTDSSQLTPEQKQALDQWLRQVPDDPSGLLRNKFQYYYQQRLQEQQEGKTGKHLNDEDRW